MYETFYNLREKPFAILPDPDYLYFIEPLATEEVGGLHRASDCA